MAKNHSRFFNTATNGPHFTARNKPKSSTKTFQNPLCNDSLLQFFALRRRRCSARLTERGLQNWVHWRGFKGVAVQAGIGGAIF
jgi:hypothetical protein